MNGKKWIKVWLTVMIFIPIVGGFNYLIDPLWITSSNIKFNSMQKGFDERQQKTNFIYQDKLLNFDGILLGSSRTTYINQNDFHNMKIYNYASSSMQPFEYQGYINFAKDTRGKSLKSIIIGADFFGTNISKDIKFKNPSYYIQNSKSASKYQSLFSFDTLKISIGNIILSTQDSKHGYDRFNIKYQDKVSESERTKRYSSNIKRHTDELSGAKYCYDNKYIAYLKKIKNDNPETKFIIFTSPVTADLLVSIIKNGKRIDEFEKWLKEIIEVFGEVNHFMTINSITTNLQNYPDDDHYYPHIAKLLANKLSLKENKNIPDDFGIILNQSNIDEYMNIFKNELKNYNNPLNLKN